MMRPLALFLPLFLWGCALENTDPDIPTLESGVTSEDAEGQTRPRARPEAADTRVAPPPEETARTEEQFDTTTKEARSAALQTPQSGSEQSLGTTIASLGAPTEPGFWMKTPLVAKEIRGRVRYPATDKSVQLTLIPIDGPTTAGSRISLAALRLIEAPLTGLPEVEVFALVPPG